MRSQETIRHSNGEDHALSRATHNLSLDSHHFQHSDSRLHLQSVRQASRLRLSHTLHLSSDDGDYGFVDVEGPSCSTVVFETSSGRHGCVVEPVSTINSCLRKLFSRCLPTTIATSAR